MADRNEVIDMTTGEVGIEDEFVLRFNKPYRFEGKEYNTIDLRGLQDISGADMAWVNRQLTTAGIIIPINPELSIEYACYMAARVTSMPVEFYMNMPAPMCIKLKNRVSNFIYSGE